MGRVVCQPCSGGDIAGTSSDAANAIIARALSGLSAGVGTDAAELSVAQIAKQIVFPGNVGAVVVWGPVGPQIAAGRVAGKIGLP